MHLIHTPHAFMKAVPEPSPHASVITELLFGEPFEVHKDAGDWCFGRSCLDGYEGYVPSACLSPANAAPTHKVAVVRTFAYPRADMKAPPAAAYSLGALCHAQAEEGPFIQLPSGLFVWKVHLQPVAIKDADFIKAAQLFLGLPYLWGGRGFEGIDCSGLVQVALQHAGFFPPRDSGDQFRTVGTLLPVGTHKARGDLVFWNGHVGLMVDEQRFLHASGACMQVVEELFEEFAQEKEAQNIPFLGVRRILI